MAEEACWKPVVWAFWDGLVGGAALIIASCMLLQYPFTVARNIAGAGVALGAVMMLLAFARAAANTYILTESHVRRVYRLIAVRIDEAPLTEVTNIVVERSLIGRILGFGDVRCDTAGTMFGGVLFKGVKNPEEVAEAIKARANQIRG